MVRFDNRGTLYINANRNIQVQSLSATEGNELVLHGLDGKRRVKKAFLSNQRKEIEGDNRMGKTRELFKKIRDNKGTFHVLYSPWIPPGQNTGVGSCSLLQGVFPIQGSNPRLLHCRWILYQLSHLGSHQENSGRSSSNPSSFLPSCVTSVPHLQNEGISFCCSITKIKYHG